MTLPILNYGDPDEAAPTGYAASASTSEEPTRRAAADDATRAPTVGPQAAVLRLLAARSATGATWRDVAAAYGWHHGQASGTLSTLHKAGRVARLSRRRDRCCVYVLPEHVAGRTTLPHGSAARSGVDPRIAEVRRLMTRFPYAVPVRALRAALRDSEDGAR